jgi:hypothetical protein
MTPPSNPVTTRGFLLTMEEHTKVTAKTQKHMVQRRKDDSPDDDDNDVDDDDDFLVAATVDDEDDKNKNRGSHKNNR